MSISNKNIDEFQSAPQTEDNRVIDCEPEHASRSGFDIPAINEYALEHSKTDKVAQPGIFRTPQSIPQKQPYEGLELSLSVENGKKVFFHGAEVARIVLTGAPLLLGRRDMLAGHYPDIDLGRYFEQDRTISRKHLRIYRDINGFWFVEDLCSNNTTFINDLNHPLNRSRAELTPGTQIIISHSIILTFLAR